MYNLRIISRENKLVLRKSKTSVRILKKSQKKVNIQAKAKRGLQGEPGDPATNLVQSVNGKQGVVVLNSVDVGADAAGAAAQALSDAKDYTDIAVSNIDTGVVSVQAGANVSVDNSDPANPVISASGGGSPDKITDGTTEAVVTAPDSNFGPGILIHRTDVPNSEALIAFPGNFGIFGNVGDTGEGNWDKGIDFSSNDFNIWTPEGGKIKLNGTDLPSVPTGMTASTKTVTFDDLNGNPHTLKIVNGIIVD